MVYMYEMFMVIYVKMEYQSEINNVIQVQNEKGVWGIIGNKGGVAYSFTLKGRLFNFIATHLRHG